jgi:hypothetical protein
MTANIEYKIKVVNESSTELNKIKADFSTTTTEIKKTGSSALDTFKNVRGEIKGFGKEIKSTARLMTGMLGGFGAMSAITKIVDVTTAKYQEYKKELEDTKTAQDNLTLSLGYYSLKLDEIVQNKSGGYKKSEIASVQNELAKLGFEEEKISQIQPVINGYAKAYNKSLSEATKEINEQIRSGKNLVLIQDKMYMNTTGLANYKQAKKDLILLERNEQENSIAGRDLIRDETGEWVFSYKRRKEEIKSTIKIYEDACELQKRITQNLAIKSISLSKDDTETQFNFLEKFSDEKISLINATEVEKVEIDKKAALEEAERLNISYEKKLQITKYYETLIKKTKQDIAISNYEYDMAAAEEANKRKQEENTDEITKLQRLKEIEVNINKEAIKKQMDDFFETNQTKNQIEQDNINLRIKREDTQKQLQSQWAGSTTDNLKNVATQWKVFGGAYKVWAESMNVIDTYRSATAAYSSLASIPVVGPVLGAVAAAAAIASGVANGVQIANQSFATGGIVGGNSFYGDRVRANVNSGEMILNRQQQATLFNQISNNTTNNSGHSITVNLFNASGKQTAQITSDLRSGSADGLVRELSKHFRTK